MSETENAAPPKPRRPTFERPVPTEEELAALDEKHGDVLHIKSPSEMSPWAIVLRRPTRPETMKWKADSRRDGNQAVLANEAFVRTLAVWPAPHVIDLMISRWSMFPDGVVTSPGFRDFIGISVDNDLKG